MSALHWRWQSTLADQWSRIQDRNLGNSGGGRSKGRCLSGSCLASVHVKIYLIGCAKFLTANSSSFSLAFQCNATILLQRPPRPRLRFCQTFIYEIALLKKKIYIYICLLPCLFYKFFLCECVLINHKYIFYELVCGRDSHFIWNNLWHIGNYSFCSLFFFSLLPCTCLLAACIRAAVRCPGRTA